MNCRRTIVPLVALLAGLAFPAVGGADHRDKNTTAAVQHAVVDFGQPQPQGAPAAVTHFLQPVGGEPDGEATIFKNGTVTFRVNGGGHGVSVYRVSKDTTRADIIGAGDGLCPTRSLPCTAAFVAAPHVITDGHGNVVIDIGANPPFGRIDDADRVFVGTTALIPDGLDANGNQIQVAGIFHQGTTAATATPNRPIGEQIRVKFTKNGRYLVICMNRGHSINDHMFSFVNVVGDDDDN
jgi:hypothetical protein